VIEGAAFLIGVVVLVFGLDANWIEVLAVALAAAAAHLAPGKAAKALEAVTRCAERLGRRKAAALILAGAGVVGLRVALLPIWSAPVPGVTDEFSHLLLADTLVRGRLTNPTHPMWPHFETIHVIHQPSYNSMYLPGQAIFLAAGRLLTGHPWGGVLLSVALMSAAFAWMLRAWMPPKWAILGALLGALRFGFRGYWGNSYWGGAVPALGGALLLGALPRFQRSPGPVPAFWLGAGAVLVLNTRPFEGLMLSLPVVWSLLIWLKRVPTQRLSRSPIPGLLTLFAVLAASAVFTAYYCWRVTGSPFVLPYRVNQRTYGWPLTLPIFKPIEVTHRHVPLQEYYAWERDEHEQLLNFWKHPFRLAADAARLWSFYFGPIMSVFLVVGLRQAGGRRRLLVAVLCLAAAAVAVEQSRYPHYIAPVTPAALALLMLGVRATLTAGSKKHARADWPAILLFGWLLAACARSVLGSPPGLAEGFNRYISSWRPPPGNLARAEVDGYLRALGGRHLAIVRYGKTHRWMDEWVYNEADIDNAPVVWARELGAEADAKLIRYFEGRRIWLVTPEEAPRIQPYRP
jgi:hypothetical protein